MTERISEQCSALAFYGITLSEGLVGTFTEIVEGWFAENSCPLTHISISAPGLPGKMAKASAVKARLQRADGAAVSDITLVSALPDAVVPLNDYAMIGSCLNSYRDMSLVARSGIVSLGSPSFYSIAVELMDLARPSYGIGYTRGHRLGPLMYALGLGQGLGHSGAEGRESLNIAFWNDARNERVWERGLLRDVYPLNFLSAPQLTKEVGRFTLRDWIESDLRRGRLETMNNGIALWEVAEEFRPTIRQELWNEGVIFNWAKHIEGADEHPNAKEVGLFQLA